MGRTSEPSITQNIPSPDEAFRVVRFVLDDSLRDVAAGVLAGTSANEALQRVLTLTIAVCSALEHLWRSVGNANPDQWEALERSARVFTDAFVLDWLAKGSAELERAVARQRRRRLALRAGGLRLVESDHDAHARWPRSHSRRMLRSQFRSRLMNSLRSRNNSSTTWPSVP